MSKTDTVTEYRAPSAFRDNVSGVYVAGILLPREQKAIGAKRLAKLVDEGRVTKTEVAAYGAAEPPSPGASRTAAATAARLAKAAAKRTTGRTTGRGRNKSTRRGAAASGEAGSSAASTD